MSKLKQGFTLMEIMIVVMIVGLLAALSFPSYQKSRESAQKSICLNNLRLLENAGDQYLFDYPETTSISLSNLWVYMKAGEALTCPINGTYNMEFDEETRATCSIVEHDH